MRICHVVLHNCVRAHKESWVLMDHGVNVHLVTEKPVHGLGWRDYDSCNLIWTGHLDGYSPDVSQLISTIKMLSECVDVFHVHNEPDWPVSIIKENTDKPVIYDIHDMVSQRTGTVDEFEQSALEACDGIVVPSGVYKEVLQKRGITKPIIELLSCVPEKLHPKIRRVPQRLGLVYEGGLKGKERINSDQFAFRSWKEVFTSISKMNVGVWVYPSTNAEDFSEYVQSGIILMQPLNYDQLLKNLTAHEAGIVGSPFLNGAFNGALPNKLFECIAAGLPVISMNAPTITNFLEATGLGVGVESIDEIPEALDSFYEENLKDYVWEVRKYWTMERQIEKLRTLYLTVTGQRRDSVQSMEISDKDFEYLNLVGC